MLQAVGSLAHLVDVEQPVGHRLPGGVAAPLGAVAKVLAMASRQVLVRPEAVPKEPDTANKQEANKLAKVLARVL